MKNTPNYNLPQYEGTDKFTKEVLNDAFSKIDLAIDDLQETFNINGTGSAITTQEVVNARGGKQNLKERIDEIDVKVDTNTEQLDNIAIQLDNYLIIGETDYTNAFIRANEKLVNGGTILLNCKEYKYSDIITLRDNVSLMCLNGYATLKALNLQKSCVKFGNNTRIENIILKSETTSRDSFDTSSKLHCGKADNVKIRNVIIDGANSAGIICYGLTNFVIENCTVKNTKADGIHITNGSKNGVIQNNIVNNVGDDGIACVSYGVTSQVENIKIDKNTVDGTNTRGITNIGSKLIWITNNTITNTATASVNIAYEQSYNTNIPSETYVINNICSNYNKTIGGLGAISILDGDGNITIDGNTILNTISSAVLKLPLLVDSPNANIKIINNFINANCTRYFNFLNTARYNKQVTFKSNTFINGLCTVTSEMFKISNLVFTDNVFKQLSNTLPYDLYLYAFTQSVIKDNFLIREDGTKGKIKIENLYESIVSVNHASIQYANNTDTNPFDNTYEWYNHTTETVGNVIPLATTQPTIRTAKKGALVLLTGGAKYQLAVRVGTNEYAKVDLT